MTLLAEKAWWLLGSCSLPLAGGAVSLEFNSGLAQLEAVVQSVGPEYVSFTFLRPNMTLRNPEVVFLTFSEYNRSGSCMIER